MLYGRAQIEEKGTGRVLGEEVTVANTIEAAKSVRHVVQLELKLVSQEKYNWQLKACPAISFPTKIVQCQDVALA